MNEHADCRRKIGWKGGKESLQGADTSGGRADYDNIAFDLEGIEPCVPSPWAALRPFEPHNDLFRSVVHLTYRLNRADAMFLTIGKLLTLTQCDHW